jgi:hypothetical protein
VQYRQGVTRPVDLHHYISFDDPHEQRTWVFDATFLQSNWSCIWGNGCKGVLPEDAQQLQQGCCSHGAHFVDDADLNAVTDRVQRLTPAQWQHARLDWQVRDPEGVATTKIVNGACIFHNEVGFSGGAGCALHNAATAAGERPIDWKPDVCWQLPLRLHEDVDGHGHVTSTLREWKRRDWGAGGDDFHWWCTESSEAFTGAVPVYQQLRDEIIEFVGEQVFTLLVAEIERPAAVAVAVEHPAVRRG